VSAAFVVDASLAMTWCFQDESTPESSAILTRLSTEPAAVPALWFLEIANVLSITERKRRITPTKTAEFIELIGELDLEIDNEMHGRAFDHLLRLSRTHGITVYDAVYLELALRLRVPLATLDTELRTAAKAEGLQLLGK
jgi:predicted nucleic acid-binding protein